MYFFLIGALCPLVGWLITLKWPNSFMKYVNFPVIFSGTGLIPPATAFNYVPWTIVGFIFNYVIRRRHFSWWTKYNCELLPSIPSGGDCLTLSSRHLVCGSRLGCGHRHHPDLLLPAIS